MVAPCMIQLYIREECPFCQKVLRHIAAAGISDEVEVVDASAGTAGRKVVLEKGGKGQVPFLVDGELSMYESDDIIAHLKDKFPRESPA